MIRTWVIPYTHTFVQIQMESEEAEQILAELEGIEDMGNDLKLVEFKLQLDAAVKKAKTYKKKNKT